MIIASFVFALSSCGATNKKANGEYEKYNIEIMSARQEKQYALVTFSLRNKSGETISFNDVAGEFIATQGGIPLIQDTQRNKDWGTKVNDGYIKNCSVAFLIDNDKEEIKVTYKPKDDDGEQIVADLYLQLRE